MKKVVLLVVGLLVSNQAFAEIDAGQFCAKLKQAKSKSNQILVVIDNAQKVRMEVFSIDPKKPLGQIFGDTSKANKDKSEMEFKTKQYGISYDYVNYGGFDLNNNGVIDENEKVARMISMLNGVRENDVVSYDEIVVGQDGLPEPKHYQDKSGYWAFQNYSAGAFSMEKNNGMDNKTIKSGDAFAFVYPIGRKLSAINCPK